MTYVYTEMAETRAKELGFDDRRAGETAYYGHEPIDGVAAKWWLEKGYIREVVDDERDGDGIRQ